MDVIVEEIDYSAGAGGVLPPWAKPCVILLLCDRAFVQGEGFGMSR